MSFRAFANERGSSLVQVLMVLVVSAVTNLALMNLLSDQGRQHRDIYVKTSALAIRQNLMGVMSNHAAWAKTRGKSAFMTCRGAKDDSPYCWGQPYRKSPGDNRGPASVSGGVAEKTIVPAAVSLNLYDARGELVHSNDPDAGYTATGEPCTGFKDSGNDDCPLKFDVEWRAVCNSVTCSATDFSAPEFVTIRARYAPKSRELETAFNPLNYGLVEQNRLLFAAQASPALDCAMKSRIFVGPGRQVNGLTADGQGCIAYEAFYGPRGERGTKGDRGFTGATGPQGPQGPAGASAVCP
ncbi:MAG: collagen-like protein [Bdellovibrionaceae bacterium]|nr:collagen-like protein [Pseudobdellovibrionaceae bacterium]